MQSTELLGRESLGRNAAVTSTIDLPIFVQATVLSYLNPDCSLRYNNKCIGVGNHIMSKLPTD